ncbi:hypothetical protein XENOCAPTIV_022560 [Xenoophorus captivus]|uniref:Uncharacterized protein n=1 Tax=Xenoophorus captivus TaxID=1517983 RepID=A0ABV0S0X9_9TELE
MSIWKLARFTHSGEVMCWSCKVLELLKAVVSRRSSSVTVAAAPRARPSEYDAKWRMKNSPMLTRANCTSELHLRVTMSRQDTVNSTAFSTSTPREPIILESIVLVTCVVG